MEVYGMLKEDGLQTNTVAFNARIDTCARMGVTDRIDELLEEMRALGGTPDTTTYAKIIKGLCMTGGTVMAAKIFRSTREHTASAEAGTYNTILEGCGKRGKAGGGRHPRVHEHEKVSPSNTTRTILRMRTKFKRHPANFTRIEC